jgi:hypothetical protein
MAVLPQYRWQREHQPILRVTRLPLSNSTTGRDLSEIARRSTTPAKRGHHHRHGPDTYEQSRSTGKGAFDDLKILSLHRDAKIQSRNTSSSHHRRLSRYRSHEDYCDRASGETSAERSRRLLDYCWYPSSKRPWPLPIVRFRPASTCISIEVCCIAKLLPVYRIRLHVGLCPWSITFPSERRRLAGPQTPRFSTILESLGALRCKGWRG